MPPTSTHGSERNGEPDLHPLYPSPAHIIPLLATDSGLPPAQKTELVTHCITRSCIFGDLSLLTYLLTDPYSQPFVNLDLQDEDGTGLVSLAIQGFAGDSERDIEREECVRLLIAHGADANSVDNSGWTALHHAALLAPPTLVVHLMTHGCSLFAVTRRNLTPLDIVTAHSTIPGREDVALLLEEAMRGEGWSSGKKEARRRLVDDRIKRKGKQRDIRDGVARALGVNPRWWGDVDSDVSSSGSEPEDQGEAVYTPPLDYTTMLAFSPPSLPEIFDSLITNFPPSLRNAEPANALYMLARFACLTCDHTWLEELIIGATDAIEETFFNRGEDVTCLVFWLYNSTVWLHLMQCDESISEACEMLGSFEMIEEVINSVFVFIIRFAERKMDQLLDAALLDYFPLNSDFDSIKFESDWTTFFLPFSGKKKSISTPPVSQSGSPLRNARPVSPNSNAHPPSPALRPSHSRGFSTSIRETLARTRNSTTMTTLNSLFPDISTPTPPSPADVTSFLTVLHSLLTLAEINPALITQLWSQVMYWTACELFNRILTRKKYVCRSRAYQIGDNVEILEEWVSQMGLPSGVASHFAPVRALLTWIQCLSSITEFSTLIATVQTLKSLNPFQMRRALREYRYEVNEGRMPEECVQYLLQLQKDWERHRLKLGVEVMRKEIGEREREREESNSSVVVEHIQTGSGSSDISIESNAHWSIDSLFDKSKEAPPWEPAKPPQVLGELLDSRHMLPLFLPSDPRLLSAMPGKPWTLSGGNGVSAQPEPNGPAGSRAEGRTGVDWRCNDRRLREVRIDMLQWVDGVRSATDRWRQPMTTDDFNEDEVDPSQPMDSDNSGHDSQKELGVGSSPRFTALTRKPSARSKGRQSLGETTFEE